MLNFIKMIIKKILLIAIVLFGAYLLFNHPSKDPEFSPMSQLGKEDVQTLSKEIARKIDEKGFDEAYRLYLHKYPGGSMVGHAADHFFGDFLYEKYGLDGIVYCQNQYTFGCEHGIIFGEIGKNGNDGIEKVATTCKKLDERENNACRHALGHTLLEIQGDEQLFDVLGFCEGLDETIKPHGCVGGAIMQYFFPALYSPTSNLPQFKSFDSNSPYGPCESAPEKFKEVCYLSLPEWWSSALNRNYEKITGLCGQVGGGFSKACFSGIGGDITYNSNYDIKTISSICGLARDSFHKDQCLGGAAAHFINNDKFEEKNVSLICGTSETCKREALSSLKMYY